MTLHIFFHKASLLGTVVKHQNNSVGFQKIFLVHSKQSVLFDLYLLRKLNMHTGNITWGISSDNPQFGCVT